MVHLIVAITGAHRAPDLPLAAAVALWPSVPQIMEEIVEIVAGEVVCNGRTGVRRQHGWTCTY